MHSSGYDWLQTIAIKRNAILKKIERKSLDVTLHQWMEHNFVVQSSGNVCVFHKLGIGSYIPMRAICFSMPSESSSLRYFEHPSVLVWIFTGYGIENTHPITIIRRNKAIYVKNLPIVIYWNGIKQKPPSKLKKPNQIYQQNGASWVANLHSGFTSQFFTPWATRLQCQKWSCTIK